MAPAIARIAFTPNVRAVQEKMGSRDAYSDADPDAAETVALSPYEIAFIRERDSFYQGTVGENGWPYVQHRGGPPGFLKVLDARTIGYADYSGNRQYISVGNLDGNDRVSLFLMDYPGQRRLKIWGRARLVNEDTEPELVARLESPEFRAPVERGVVITIEAFDWNCPKYITPRFTEHEAKTLFGAGRNDAANRTPAAAAAGEIGTGPLKLVVTGIRQLTPRVRAYELRAPDGRELPEITPGAHLPVPVRLPDGSVVTRQYSVASHPGRRDVLEIAVLREDDGRGGSAAIHDTWQIGTRLALGFPVNQFPLHRDRRHSILIAGGIGITPIKAMAHALQARNESLEIHYSSRTPAEMAYREQMAEQFGGQFRPYFTQSVTANRIDLVSVMRDAPADALFYVCGPRRLIEAARKTAHELGLAAERLQFESFD